MPLQQKSPYALQFEDFEKRFEKSTGKNKLPCVSSRIKKITLIDQMQDAEYLDLAKRLINNQERHVFCHDKENVKEAEAKSKDKHDRMQKKVGKLLKRFSKDSESRSSQRSENLNPPPSQVGPSRFARESVNSNRSRALSSTSSQRENEPTDAISFLNYKKCKRDLSIRSKN